MKTNLQRLNNIIGQVEGVKRMMGNRQDCLAIITQLKAIKAAVNKVMDGVIEEQFDNCLKSIKEKDKALLIKMKNYVYSN